MYNNDAWLKCFKGYRGIKKDNSQTPYKPGNVSYNIYTVQLSH